MRRDLSLSSTIKGYFDTAGLSKSPFRPIALDTTAKVEPKSGTIQASSIASIQTAKFASTPSCNRRRETMTAARDRRGCSKESSHGSRTFSEVSMAANPYIEARREWDERYADLVLGKRNWQIAAGGLLVLSLILASANVWLVSRSRYVPYVVEVDKLGYALTVPQPLTPTSIPDVTTRMERYEVAAFIRSARSVSSDPQVEHQMLNSLLAHARGAADRFLDAYYHSDSSTHNPFKLQKSKPSRFRSIRFFSFHPAATRCAGRSSNAI